MIIIAPCSLLSCVLFRVLILLNAAAVCIVNRVFTKCWQVSGIAESLVLILSHC
ncbi:hypothetical protein LINPERHAP1_LOCUS20501 [Linum perenne]